MRVVFFGTSDFAVPSLLALTERFSVVGVITQPDRPAGRGRHPRPPPVKGIALDLGLPVLQPEKVRSPQVLAALTAWLPDVAVVAAYGQILPRTLLAVPSKGCVNVHASLLPRWRGASPVQAALLHGDAETGVTLMQMDEGMDTGPILAQRGLAIRPDHSGGSLSSELATLGAQLLIDTLPSYLSGDVTPVAQDDRLSTVAPRLRSSDANLDPTLPASQLERQIRAFSPRPGARFRWGQDALRILDAHVMPGSDAPSGTVLAVPGGLAMATGEGLLVFDRVQLAGGKPVAGNAFLAGHRAILGAVLNRSA